ncbi:beta-1,4-glucuronyltransferase 1-like isoform X1 [Amblyomma americanum]
MSGAPKVSLRLQRRRKLWDRRFAPFALALLFVVGLGAYAFQRSSMRAAALNRLARLGRHYREPFYGPPTQPATPGQQHRRPLMSPKADTAADGDVAKRRLCVEGLAAADRSAAGGHPRRQRRQCNYTSDSGAIFVVLENFVECDGCRDYEEDNVTLATHASYGFLRHIPELCDRWQGLLSVAVFAPGSDFDDALSTIAAMRHCSRNPCVRKAVTWHLVYDGAHTPASLATGSPQPWDTRDLRRSDHLCSSLTEPQFHPDTSFKRMQGLPYPANVLRNVARMLAPTRYVLVQDVRLYPSANIVPRFLSYVAEQRRLRSLSDYRDVFVLPVFEAASLLKEGATVQQWVPPRTMRQLEESLRSGMVALPLNDPSQGGALWSLFFPAGNATGSLNASSTDEETRERLGVFETFKRNRTLQLWEPVFLGTKEDPAYDERFRWEAGGDRVSQGYLMCLQDYVFHIVDGAFLVRVPRATGETDGAQATISGPPIQGTMNFDRFKISVASKYSSALRDLC